MINFHNFHIFNNGNHNIISSRSLFHTLDDQTKHVNISYAMTGGSAAREAELQKTLQSLLERYNGSLMPNSFVQGGTNTGQLIFKDFYRLFYFFCVYFSF